MLPSVLLAPLPTLEVVREEGDGGRGTRAGREVARQGFLILTGGTDGVIKVFETMADPVLI